MAPDYVTVRLSPYAVAGTLGTGVLCFGGCGSVIYESGRYLCWICNQKACSARPSLRGAPDREPRTGPKQRGEWWKR